MTVVMREVGGGAIGGTTHAPPAAGVARQATDMPCIVEEIESTFTEIGMFYF